MECACKEQLRQRQVEHPDGVLYQDVLLVVTKAFHPAIVCALTDSPYVIGIAVVAVYPCVCSITFGLLVSRFHHQLQPCSQERFELLLSRCHILRTASILRMGKFGRDIVVAVYENEIG